MATADDVVNLLLDKSHSIAKKIDDTPTGVAPGYHRSLRGAVLPNGRMRYADALASATFAKHVGTTPTINNNTLTRYDFSTDTANWLNPSALSEIVLPGDGLYMVVAAPYWVTTNLVGDRGLDMSQIRDSVSPGYVWDSRSSVWPALNTNVLATHVPLTWLFDCVAGDKLVFDNWHNGGVNTLKCKLDVWVTRLG